MYTGLEYRERLKRANLTTLEIRRKAADLLEVFKIINGLQGVKELRDSFERRIGVITGHNCKLFKKRCTRDIAKYGFGNRVGNDWNYLTQQAADAKSINEFRGIIDRYLTSY